MNIAIMFILSGISDLQDVLVALVDVNTKWKLLGLALGLKQPTLSGIREGEYDECKMAMLTKWLNQVDGCQPSWNDLVEGLRAPTVKHYPIADAIKQKYLH